VARSNGDSRSVLLGDVLHLERKPVKVDPSLEYPNLGLYSFGKGVFPKSPISGAATSAPTLYRVKAGQFIYSRLFAFEGAFAVVPSEMDGWFVSNEYPTFDVDESKVLAGFLRLSICRRATWEELAGMTVGMGHRRQRLHPDAFLAFEMDLPPLEEQHRIVGAVGAADGLARAAIVEAQSARALATALHGELSDGPDSRRVKLGDVAELDLHQVSVAADQEYSVAGVLIAGGGLFWRPTIKGSETNYPRLNQLRADQLVYRKLTAWEGPITVVPTEFEGACVSPEFPTFTLDQSQLLPDFMRFLCERPSFHAEMRARATGTPERRNRLKPADLLEIELELPPLSEQQKIAAASRASVAAEAEAWSARGVAEALPDRLLSSAAEELAAA
jgi:type I restriction enzyme S subunit